MQEWKEIVKIALVGTGRQEVTLPDAEDPVGTLCRQVDAGDREHALLHIGAILACCRRAGMLPARDDQELPAPAEREDLPCIGPVVAQDLDRMLHGDFVEAMPDWLAAVAAKGRRVPEERLVDLLVRGERQTELRPAITGVIGRRGRWLAAQNPDWKYPMQHSLFAATLAGEAPLPEPAKQERLWQTGTREERLALLERIRATEPARADALVLMTWTQDPFEDRALFIETFARGLSMDDEPLLESALDDRRKEVRQQAVALLSRLPGSRLCARMIERARPLLNDQPGVGLQVTLPTECDKAMQRDGILPKPPPGMGEKGWWLQQILSAVPLAHWQEQFGKTPEKIVHSNRMEEWRDTILGAWLQALQRFPEPGWAEVLLDEWLKHDPGQHARNYIQYDIPWHTLLPQPVLEDRSTRVLRENPYALAATHRVAYLLPECKETWGTELTRAVLTSLQQTLAKQSNSGYQITLLMENYAPLMARDALEDIRTLCETVARDSYLAQRLERHYVLAQFRTEMLQRIAAD